MTQASLQGQAYHLCAASGEISITVCLQFFTCIFECESTNALPCFAGLPCNLRRIVLVALDSLEMSKGNAVFCKGSIQKCLPLGDCLFAHLFPCHP